jgi:hypothetical protein
VNFNSREPANKPRYIRHSRNNEINSSSSSDNDSEYSSSDSDYSSKDKDINDSSEAENKNDNKDDNPTEITHGLIENNNKDSNPTEKTHGLIENNNKDIDQIEKMPEQQPTLVEFISHVPVWGAKIIFRDKIVNVSNTCTIDYFLLALWVLHKRVPNFIEGIIPQQELTLTLITQIIADIEDGFWDTARGLWILEVLKLSPNSRDLSLFGSELKRFFSYWIKNQKHDLVQICQESCSENKKLILETSKEHIYFKKDQKNINGQKNEIKLSTGFKTNCPVCKAKIDCEIRFLNIPNILFIESAWANIYVSDLPKIFTFDGRSFKFLCATVHSNQNHHFYGVFDLNDELYLVDDLRGSPYHPVHKFIDTKLTKKTTSVSLYYLI